MKSKFNISTAVKELEFKMYVIGFYPIFQHLIVYNKKKWEEITDASQGLSEVMACGKLQLSFVGVIFGCLAHARPPSIPRNQNCVPVSFCGSAVL